MKERFFWGMKIHDKELLLCIVSAQCYECSTTKLVISFNPLRVFLRFKNPASMEFLRDFIAFCWKSWRFLRVLIFAPIYMSPSPSSFSQNLLVPFPFFVVSFTISYQVIQVRFYYIYFENYLLKQKDEQFRVNTNSFFKLNDLFQDHMNPYDLRSQIQFQIF